MCSRAFPDPVEPVHPRPQLRRDCWESLNGPWKFTFDDANQFEHPDDVEHWTHTIEVPFGPETPASGIEAGGFHQNFWYEREFEAESGPDRVILHFGAVDYQAKVWLNGKLVAQHEGGFTPFSVDITDALDPSGHQKVTVWAEDDPHELAKPRGKQDWQENPHGIWYPRTSGIWQTVWLERVPETYIDRIRWTPHFERWEIGFEGFVQSRRSLPRSLRMAVKLAAGGRSLADDVYQVQAGEVHRRIVLSDPGIDDYRNELLWSPEKPTLIEATIELWDGQQLIDHVHSYTALRTVSIQRNKFMLNGRPYYLRLVLDQGYWPETHLTPPSDEAIRSDIELVKKMGFNGVRKHQKIEDPRFLYWADVMGLLVWEEMPSAYRFTEKSVERLTREWQAVIARDSSHPCIVAWVPFNESWGVPDLTATAAHRHYVQGIYHLTKSLDPTRPVIGNDGWENLATDIVAIHDYERNPEELLQRYGTTRNEIFESILPAGRQLALDDYSHDHQPVMLTEFGGIALTPVCDEQSTWGYSRCTNSEEFKRNYSRLLAAVNQVELFSGFCYTQLTDTFQEANGLLYADRTPKFPLEDVAAATRGRGMDTGYWEQAAAQQQNEGSKSMPPRLPERGKASPVM